MRSPASGPCPILGVAGLFNMYCRLFNPKGGRGSIDGVRGRCIVDEYRAALETVYPRLTSRGFGWTRVLYSSVAVHIEALPCSGYVAPRSGATPPSISLTSRGWEPRRAGASQRRWATVVHELVHMLQFELFTSSPPPSLWGWWNEASAVASESAVLKRNCDWFRFLRPWIDAPEESLDGGDPYRTAPFALYLMRVPTLGPGIVRRTYEIGGPHDGAMEAIDAIAQAMPQGLPLASATGPDVFGSGYCCDAYLLGDPNSHLYNVNFRRRFGDRLISESFEKYPVKQAAGGDSIDHLGCRYYRFYPCPGSSVLKVSVELPEGPSRQHLRGELIAVSEDGRRIGQQVTLERGPDDASLAAELRSFTPDKLDHAALVLSNCAYGQGAPDGLTFSITGELASDPSDALR